MDNMTKNAIDVLKENQSRTPSKWRENAEWVKDNWCWLRYSKQIAIAARSRMKSLGITQRILAEKMGCSQQYVSLLLQGNENLTLETIARLESILSTEFISILSSNIQTYNMSQESCQLTTAVCEPDIVYSSNE